MNKFRIYLSGASKNVESNGNKWRMEAEQWEIDFPQLDIWNPNSHYNYTTLLPNSNKECMKLFLHAVETSDVILVNLDNTDRSVGTGIELGLAIAHNIPIIGFYETKNNIYPWAEEACDVILDSLEAARNYILLHYAY